MKTCPACRRQLSAEQFYVDKAKRSGLSTYCRICCSKRAKLYYTENSDRVKLRVTAQTKQHKSIDADEWRRSRTKIAGKYRRAHPVVSRNASLKHYRTVKGRVANLLRAAQRRAEERGLEFDLTPEWLVAKLSCPCPLTGWRFDLGAPEGTHFNPRSPSIDRVSSDGGYTQTNCRVICTMANLAKHEFSDTLLVEFCEAVVQTISSRALPKGIEGSTTRAKARRAKRPEAPEALPAKQRAKI